MSVRQQAQLETTANDGPSMASLTILSRPGCDGRTQADMAPSDRPDQGRVVLVPELAPVVGQQYSSGLPGT